MTTELVLAQEKLPAAFAGRPFPAVIIQAGPEACRHFVEVAYPVDTGSRCLRRGLRAVSPRLGA